MRHRTLLLLPWLILSSCASVAPSKGLLGAYLLEDGQIVSIRRDSEDSLRYRLYQSGSSGRLYPDSELSFVSGAGFSQRDPVQLAVRFLPDEQGVARELEWAPHDKSQLRGRRIGRERDVWIAAGDTRLFGRLHLPEGPPPYPGVVLVHGSGAAPGTEWFYNSDFFVANGIAALTYDKRGSGRSEGSFSFDFRLLAADASAALEHLTSVPEIDPQRVGFVGYSQGAWVAPLASEMNESARFVVVNYGMIESPAQEARLEMRQLLVDAGASQRELAEADELIGAAVDLVAAGFESGWPQFLAFKSRYRAAPWLVHLDGTPVDQLMTFPKWLVRLIGKRRLPAGLNWHYDSTELLEQSDVPMVWLLAANDRSAPNEATIAKLRSLIEDGKPYELLLFPEAGHGMRTYTEINGERIVNGYAPGYFQAEVEALQRLAH